jgi:pimeloyl-ACP methyl ester carboxylesterase
MPVVVRNGVALHVQSLGAAGTPIVMLHGLLVGSLTTWYFAAGPRLARTHRVTMYDLRGHGRSERAKSGYGLDTMADDLRAVISEESEKVTLIGHSYGALTALRFTMREPERVARLVLVDAPIPPWQVGEFGALAKRGPEEIIRTMPPLLAGAVERGGRAGAKLLAQVQFLAMESTLFDDLSKETSIDFDVPSFRAALEAIRVPTICIYGSRSSCVGAGERIARAIPGAQMITLEGGHFLPVEAPHAVADRLEEICRG